MMRENAALSLLGRGLLAYADVLALAQTGPVGPELLRVLREEHAHRERAARPVPHRVDAMTALAAALVRHAHSAPDFAGRADLHREAAGLLQSALALDPGSDSAARSLAALARLVAQAPQGE
jgi:hypothetical protein